MPALHVGAPFVEDPPGAPHSFFDRRFEEHADASADAWERIVDFLDRLPVAA